MVLQHDTCKYAIIESGIGPYENTWSCLRWPLHRFNCKTNSQSVFLYYTIFIVSDGPLFTVTVLGQAVGTNERTNV